MKLEELVPPLELCKKIPTGEFKDSCFVWAQMYRYEECQVIPRKIVVCDLRTAPAPTLQEIMQELDPLQDAFFADFDDGTRAWMVADSGYESNAATAAIKAWLGKKGIAL